MPDDVETMMFLGKTPWHGKGIQIQEDDAYDINKCIDYAGLNWEVKSQQCYINIINGIIENRKLVDAWATIRTSDNIVLGIVGQRYEIIQNKKAFQIFQPLLDSKLVKLNTAGSLHDGKKIWILAEIAGDPIFIRENDYIRKFILLSHGHDGNSIVRFGLTPIRVVCANTLAMAHQTTNLFKFKHTKNTISNLESARDMISSINEDYKIASTYYKSLDAKNCSLEILDLYIKDVFNFHEENLSTRSYNIIEKIKSYFIHAPGAQGKSMWDAYNAITYYLSHDYGNNVDNRLSTLWFGKSAEISKYALKLATE